MKLILILLSITTSAVATVPNGAYTLDFNINMIGFSKSRETKIYDATDVIRKVVSSPEFKDEVLGHTYQGKRAFADSKGLSNSEIYKKIFEGAEKLTPEKNNTMDLDVELFTDLKSVTIGFTKTNSSRIWINTKYFNSLDVESVAANLMHEWLHKLGFTHDVSATVKRNFSVPYAVGRIVARLGRKLN